MPLCATIKAYRLSESDVTNIDALEATPPGGYEDILENIFERNLGIPGHLLRPFKGLGGRDGAWAKLCEQITTAAPPDRDAKVQEALHEALNWTQYDNKRGFTSSLTVEDGSVHQVPVELVVDLLPGDRRFTLGPDCYSVRQPIVIEAVSPPRLVSPSPVPSCMTGSLLA